MSTVGVNVNLKIDPVAFRRQFSTITHIRGIVSPPAADDLDGVIELLDDVLEKIIAVENKREEASEN